MYHVCTYSFFFLDVSVKMSVVFVIVLLFGSTVGKVSHRTPSSFRRGSVESVPNLAADFFQNYGSHVHDSKIIETFPYDSISLPNSRYAVEKAPTKEQRLVNCDKRILMLRE